MIASDGPDVQIFDVRPVEQAHNSVNILVRWVQLILKVHIVSHRHQEVDMPSLLLDFAYVSVQSIEI